MSRVSVLAAVICVAAAPAFGEPQSDAVWSVQGFEEPESALFDPVRNQIVVSNIVGHPGAADKRGHLSLLSTDGTVLDPEWTSGLNAPKGMALVGDTILVADLKELHLIDAASGERLRSIEVADAVFLNDVTTNGTVAWITDLMDHTIWRFEDGEMSLWLQDERLSHPNGILFDDERLLVGSWGSGMRDDFSTERPGSLLSVDLATREITTLPGGAALGNLDGVIRLGNAIVTNDWITGEVFRVEGGEVSTVAALEPGLADIAAFENGFIAPLMRDARMKFYIID